MKWIHRSIKYQERMEYFLNWIFALQFQAFIQVTKEKKNFLFRRSIMTPNFLIQYFYSKDRWVSQLLFQNFRDGERDLDFHCVGPDWQHWIFLCIWIHFLLLTKRKKKAWNFIPSEDSSLFFSFSFGWRSKDECEWLLNNHLLQVTD